MGSARSAPGAVKNASVVKAASKVAFAVMFLTSSPAILLP
jgi:hypothetical protein